MDSNSLLNGAYHSTVLTGLLFTNCMIAEKVFKVRPPNLGRLDVKDVGQLALNVFVAEMTRTWLVKQKIIPDNIILSTPINPQR